MRQLERLLHRRALPEDESVALSRLRAKLRVRSAEARERSRALEGARRDGSKRVQEVEIALREALLPLGVDRLDDADDALGALESGAEDRARLKARLFVDAAEEALIDRDVVDDQPLARLGDPAGDADSHLDLELVELRRAAREHEPDAAAGRVDEADARGLEVEERDDRVEDRGEDVRGSPSPAILALA